MQRLGRIALVGLSLGAHLAPRAASGEHRLAACIADCGAFDLHAAALERIPGPLAGGLARGSRTASAAVREMMGLVLRRPTAGWALRRGLLVHGVSDPVEIVEALEDFTSPAAPSTSAAPPGSATPRATTSARRRSSSWRR